MTKKANIKVSPRAKKPEKVKSAARAPLTFHLITLFPESFSSYLGESILARAEKNKLLAFKYYNPRSFVKPTKTQSKNEKPYLRIDDKAYGGGPGMVMQALPVIKAIEKALAVADKKTKAKPKAKSLIVFLAPSGEQFTNALGTEYAAEYTDIIIICGRYEGIDARVKKIFKTIDITVGPFVTTGGELPAMIMIDVIARQIPGVLGSFDSREESRASSRDVYTRPESFEYKDKAYKVPEVLLSGNHKLIDEWRASEERKGGAN